MNDIVSLQEILRIEQSISVLLKTAQDDIIKEIETTEIEGVKNFNCHLFILLRMIKWTV